MTPHCARRLLAITAVVVLVATTARAAWAEDQALTTARRHFERGEKLYAATRFSEALDAYQRAFDAAPLAGFLFNIGQCYRNLGDYDAAVFSYRQYLKLAPAASNRAQVEQLIGELEAKRDQAAGQRLGLVRSRSAAPAAPAPAPAAPPGDSATGRSVWRSWWLWTAIAAVGAAGGVTVYAVTRPPDPPGTDLGNIVFGR